MKITKYEMISCAGMGLMVGSLVTVVKFSILIVFALGLGLFSCGIFKTIKNETEYKE